MLNCIENGQEFQAENECPPGTHPVTVIHAAAGTPWWHYVIIVLAALLLLSIILSAFRIVRAYEKGVVLRFGRVVGEREPGLRLVMPLIDRMYHVDLRVITLSLEPQQVITKDSVSLGIHVVVYYRVTNATDSVVEIEYPSGAVEQLGQAIMRKVVGQKDLNQLLEHGDQVTQSIETELENSAQDWGLKITRIEIKDLDLPEGMQRAMGAQAEATREAVAKIAAAEGEKNSAAILREAADLLTPTALRLRELQTLREIGTEHNTVIVAPNAGFGELAGASAAGALAAAQ